ncbi:A disintegrin and metalloproteinase with thrombospondin motifs adt-1-like isoform X2 [Mercenaria mercenaria]|uniref:A disintegrin and metalloproteinase with thrombospondin motifs adt-1-like isoform X2 n=1 Tax=Mercenaria mercenaria TaxID=6596 RepID=UPI00234EB849|nr:A disintegrin and metalloproteinase with thrombospondin motifs adt-1-like isoform X2 [Mercenaria mercenaria]
MIHCTYKACPVDGHWASWGPWEHCSSTCGYGAKNRNRTCSNPPPSGGGKTCAGTSTATTTCKLKTCPVDGHWTSWGQWGQCSVTCGGGTKLRHRTCTHPAPSDGGKTCSGSSSLAGSCSTTSCPVDGHWHHWQAWGSCSVTCGHGTKTRVRTCTSILFGGKPCTGSSHNSTTCGSPCPIDGHWGGWGAWGTCSVTCGNGKESRARTCSNPQPAYGGKQCVGETSDARSCGQPCRIDGHWSQWGRWGHCSVTCGTGTKSRSRTCSHPKPSGGGKSCSGSDTSTTPCTSTACPVDGHWASWGHWGHCSVTCGDGTKGRNRTCTNPSPSGGGKTCAGSSASTTACSSKACPVDGHWASWGHWGHCSVTCGDGTKARNRTCTNPSPSGGGKTCAGSSATTTTCSPKACPVDGHWNHWQAWGSCSVTCGAGTKTRVRSCSRVLYGGKPCSGSSSKSASCGSPCPIDGQWGTWEAWGTCSVTCGSGKETRARTCSDPQPARGGKQCVGESSESRHCGQPCKVDGQWGAWQAWGTCSVTCGDGKEKRTRTCSNPQPAYGGKQCAGDATQARHCGQPCKIDGQWTTWQEWTKCSKSCASGTRSRARTCTNPAPANGGTDCTGDKSVTESCNTDSCPQWSRWFHDACSVSCGNGTTMRLRHCSSGKDADCGSGKAFENVACSEKPCPVDGSWGTWNIWSQCTATCGEGQHSRTRLCNNPSPQNGGADCSGSSDETAVCNTHECPHWLPFQELSSCSVTCGKGFIQLKRTCSTGIESDCTGSAYNEKTCILDECI